MQIRTALAALAVVMVAASTCSAQPFVRDLAEIIADPKFGTDPSLNAEIREWWKRADAATDDSLWELCAAGLLTDPRIPPDSDKFKRAMYYLTSAGRPGPNVTWKSIRTPSMTACFLIGIERQPPESAASLLRDALTGDRSRSRIASLVNKALARPEGVVRKEAIALASQFSMAFTSSHFAIDEMPLREAVLNPEKFFGDQWPPMVAASASKPWAERVTSDLRVRAATVLVAPGDGGWVVQQALNSTDLHLKRICLMATVMRINRNGTVGQLDEATTHKVVAAWRFFTSATEQAESAAASVHVLAALQHILFYSEDANLLAEATSHLASLTPSRKDNPAAPLAKFHSDMLVPLRGTPDARADARSGFELEQRTYP